MKIAVLSPFYPYRGGIAQFSAMLYKALEKEHTVKAFSFSRLYPEIFFPGKTQYVEDEDNAVAISSERVLDSINPVSYWKTAKVIQQFQPDLLIIAYWTSFFCPAYAYIAWRLKKKIRIISLLHNAIPHELRFFDKIFARLFFDQCNSFMVMSEIVKNDLLTLKPNARFCLRSHPLYNHFGEKKETIQARKELNLDLNRKTLLFFGLIRNYKGLDLLIDALSLLDDSYQLLIAGESYGPFEKYQKQIDASPAKKRIQILNRYINDKEVPVLFSAADTLVLPYKSATQSGVIPVAYHFETPIVATDVGGLKETVEKAQTGIICLPEAGSLASGIEKIFQYGKENFIAHIQKEKKTLSWEMFAKSLIQDS
jgi:glycosyltransferase involved in cell wall biosynthesis